VALSEIVLVGINHKQAPVHVREHLAFATEEVLPFVEELSRRGQVRGAVLLSTCNRVELYADVAEGLPADSIVDTFLETRDVPKEYAQFFYSKRRKSMVQHLFSVAAGLDSMVLGEPQILGQVKDAYAISRESGFVTTPLNLLFQKAFHVAKKTRTETGIGEHPVTVSYAAFNLARSIFEDLTTKRVMILGAGEMSRILATHFFESGVRQVKVANRTLERAAEFAKTFGAEVVPWDIFPRGLVQSDIVISSTGSPKPIIHRPMMETIMKLRRNSAIFMIDIAVPRDMGEGVEKVDGVYLYNIDDLQQVADEGLAERRRQAVEAEALIQSEVDLYSRYLEHQELSHLIEGLVSWAQAIEDTEVAEALRKLDDLPDRHKEVIRKTVRRVVHKLLHSPITQVKRLVVEDDSTAAVSIFQELFPLKEREDTDKGDQ
jgi:glutamyl-tRNA reductase